MDGTPTGSPTLTGSPLTTPPLPPTPPPAAVVPTVSTSFYMRPLPSSIISYESAAGKSLFKQALLSSGLEAFFPLSQQFLTQSEPAFCGIGTLCMILNALKIDPAQTWRKPWRWYSEDMLDCCRPLEVVKKQGITLSEFSCLARCNGLEAVTKYAREEDAEAGFEEFVEDVKKCTSSAETLMAVSYSRAGLGQTGSGHFSPVGGYATDPELGGMVLVLDVARFKYPSYWTPIRLLYDALKPADPATGQPRGYSVLRKRPAHRPGMLRLNANKKTWPMLYAPMKAVAAEAGSYEQLIGNMAEMLRAPSSIPVVASRLEGARSYTSLFSPAMDMDKGAEALNAYTLALERLKKRFSRSEFWVLLEREGVDVMWRTEVAVLVLAVFGLRSFVRGLKDEAKEGVRSTVEKEVVGEVGAEVDEVRRQMESLEECCVAEGCCGDECRKEGKCGMDRKIE